VVVSEADLANVVEVVAIVVTAAIEVIVEVEDVVAVEAIAAVAVVVEERRRRNGFPSPNSVVSLRTEKSSLSRRFISSPCRLKKVRSSTFSSDPL